MRATLCSRLLVLAGVLAAILCSVASVQATMKVYYDPATGNIAFDTAETRSGAATGYAFLIDAPRPPTNDWAFRTENLIRLTNSTIFYIEDIEFGESSTAPILQGLYTIGDVFPIGLTEEFWTTKLVTSLYPERNLISFGYVDVIGGGTPPDAEFIYGPPTGDFDNDWNLVDPDTLTWASTATLVYRSWSGEVLVDTQGASGGFISAIWLESAGAFLPSGFNPTIGGPSNSATVNDVFVLADAVGPGSYTLGEILPAGLSAAEFEATFSSALFVGHAAFNSGSFDFATDGAAFSLSYAVVPEPSSLALMCVAMLAAVGWLRRQERS